MGTIEWMSTAMKKWRPLPLALKHNFQENGGLCRIVRPRKPALNQRPVRCHRNHVPVLAIAAHIPSSEMAAAISRKPTHKSYSANVVTLRAGFQPGANPTSAGDCHAQAVLNRGVSVVVLPGDVALKLRQKGQPRTGIMRHSQS